MSDNETPETLHTCAVTGEEGPGKHYILRTTEGEELVSPDALLNPVKALMDFARKQGQLEVRIEKLEKERDLWLAPKQEDGDQEEKDEHHQAAEKTPVAQAAKKTTAAKKATG